MKIALLIMLLVCLAVVLWVQWVWSFVPHLDLSEVVYHAADVFWYNCRHGWN